MPAQLDQQQKRSTPFPDSFTNPTDESGLSLADKHYVNNSDFHS